MSGKTRFVIFTAALWVMAWAVMYFIFDRSPSRAHMEGFVLFGVLPAAIGLLAWWVRLGFVTRSGTSNREI